MDFGPIKLNEMKTIEFIKSLKDLECTYKEKYMLTMISAYTMDEPFIGTVQELCQLCNFDMLAFSQSKEKLITNGLLIKQVKHFVYSYEIEKNQI